MKPHVLLGLDGNICKEIAKRPIQPDINQMHTSEDFQMILGKNLMKNLKGENKLWKKE